MRWSTKLENSSFNSDNYLGKVGINTEQSSEALTVHGARYLGEEETRGTIETGKRADFAVLSSDPYVTGAEQLSEIVVHATVIAGEIVYGSL